MARQHKASRRRVLRSSMKHKFTADLLLDTMEELTANIAAARAKVAADAETVVLTGSIDPTASTSVVGVGTLFTTELEVGDFILVSGETREVATITDDTNLTVTVAFSDNANDTSPEKVAAWDKDYAATAGVTAVDFDAKTVGQHEQPARKVIIDKMAHRKLGDEITDLLEESQVTLNLILAQMDADAGTLSVDATYEAFRVADPIKVTSVFQGPHKAYFQKMMTVAVKHNDFGKSISEELAAIQSGLNAMIDEIQAKNA